MTDTSSEIIIHGHRGCRGVLPENTIPAFLRALEDGADIIEMDVVCTSDNRILVSHDPFMHHEICAHPDDTPITEQEEFDLNVFRMALNETQRYPCGIFPHQRFPEQDTLRSFKPSLAEVAQAVKSYCADHNRSLPGLNIEIKSRPEWDGNFHPDPADYTTVFLRELNAVQNGFPLTVQSFDVRILRELRNKADHIRLIYLTEAAGVQPQAALGHLGFQPYGYSPHFNLIDEKVVKFCESTQLVLCAWTVNEEEDIRRMIHLGVRQIISDFPKRVATIRKEMSQ